MLPDIHVLRINAAASKRGGRVYGASKSVSRVLYLTVIYLGAALPLRSRHLPEAAGQAVCFHHGVAPDRVYRTGPFPAGR